MANRQRLRLTTTIFVIINDYRGQIMRSNRVSNSCTQSILEYHYEADDKPFVMFLTGNKNSLCELISLWGLCSDLSVKGLPLRQIFIVANTQNFGNLVVTRFVDQLLVKLEDCANTMGFPITVIRSCSKVDDMWVDLLGHRRSYGYHTATTKLFVDAYYDVLSKLSLVYGGVKFVSSRHQRNKIELETYNNSDVHVKNATVIELFEGCTSDDLWIYLFQSKQPWLKGNYEVINLYFSLGYDVFSESCGCPSGSIFECSSAFEADESMPVLSFLQNQLEDYVDKIDSGQVTKAHASKLLTDILDIQVYLNANGFSIELLGVVTERKIRTILLEAGALPSSVDDEIQLIGEKFKHSGPALEFLRSMKLKKSRAKGNAFAA